MRSFCGGVRVRDGDDAVVLALAHGHAGLAPAPPLLPAEAGGVQGAADRVGADAGKAIRRPAQGVPQRGQRPGRRAVPRAIQRPGDLGEDALLLGHAVADLVTAAVARHESGQPIAVEVRDPARDGVGPARGP